MDLCSPVTVDSTQFSCADQPDPARCDTFRPPRTFTPQDPVPEFGHRNCGCTVFNCPHPVGPPTTACRLPDSPRLTHWPTRCPGWLPTDHCTLYSRWCCHQYLLLLPNPPTVVVAHTGCLAALIPPHALRAHTHTASAGFPVELYHCTDRRPLRYTVPHPHHARLQTDDWWWTD